MESSAAKVAIDQEDLDALLREDDREVGRNSGFPFAGERTGDQQRLEANGLLRKQQGRAQCAVRLGASTRYIRHGDQGPVAVARLSPIRQRARNDDGSGRVEGRGQIVLTT